jgi:hypothetical protein
MITRNAKEDRRQLGIKPTYGKATAVKEASTMTLQSLCNAAVLKSI